MGRKKLVAEKPLGRHYFCHPAFSLLPRAVRADFVPAGTVEFDQVTAIAAVIIKLAAPLHIQTPCMKLYQQNKNEWRECVAQYYDLGLEDSKTIIQKALFGFVETHPERGTLPLLQGLRNFKPKVL